MSQNALILGAAGRDFHNFNVFFRGNPAYHVVAFTAAQIPNIADRRYPAALAGPDYPFGIPILPEEELDRLVRDLRVDVTVFAYSDVSHEHVMHIASRSLAAGSDFLLLGPRHTMLKARVPVIAVCAARTGAGKSQTTRRLATLLEARGIRPVVVRHPMPYGDLARQAVQRFAQFADLDTHRVTIEEREEYEPLLRAGRVVYAGVDYERILREAEREGDIILWDGGNNDTPFYKSDLEIVVVDPHRPGHELAYYPGEVNLRRADVLVMNKVDTAQAHDIETVRRNIQRANPDAIVCDTACRVSIDDPETVRGKHVLVVEDGPTLTHGEMPYGAGVVASGQYLAAQRVDPRPHAVGSIRSTFEKFPHLHDLLPAMGYSETQRHELEETINRTPCDLVVLATPVDLRRILRLNKPCVRVGY